jgi:putative transposase
MAIELITEACADGATESKSCAVLGFSCRTFRRWCTQMREAGKLADQRQESALRRNHPQALSEEEKEQIVEVCNTSENRSLPPSQIIPKLADQGIYIASESTFYRVLKQAGQSNRRGRAEKPKLVARPRAWSATGPNQVWSWDITFLPTQIKGDFYRLYMIEDVYSRKIVGWEVHFEESACRASTLIEKAYKANGIGSKPLVLHSDNGSPMKGATMLATLQKLGVMPSFSRPSVSDDNPYSESLFRTLKYCPRYPSKPFGSIDSARQWVMSFVNWYNHQHRHSGIKFVTPAQRHEQVDAALLANRTTVYERAKASHPHRWKSRSVRNWSHIGEVWLNPPKEHRHD